MRKENPNKFFSEEEKERLIKAIQDAERRTSGEIRVHLAHHSKQDPMEEAKAVFEKLGMTQTAERNGILFFLSLKDHRFVVLGDEGIHEKVGQDFWESIREEMIRHFKEERFIEGLVAGIQKAGDQLTRHFPRQSTDRDEHSNDLSHS